MDDGEVLRAGRRDGNARDSFGGRRKRGKKRERQMADGVAKLGAVCTIPGIEGIERIEFRNSRAFDHAH